MKHWLALLSGLLVSTTVAQVTSTTGSGVTYQPGGVRTTTVVVCAPDTVGQPAGCDFVTSGLTGAAGSITGDEVTLLAQAQSCGAAFRTTFTGQITTGNTLTVTGGVTGTPIYVGMPLNGSGITNQTWVSAFGTGIGGNGVYTVNNINGSSSAPNVGPETMTGPWPECKLHLRAGTYNTCGSWIPDRSNIDIEGEGDPYWGSYIINQSGASGVMTATVGSGYTKIAPNWVPGTASGHCAGNAYEFDAVHLGNVNIPDGGENRHRAVHISNIYVVGPQLAANYCTTCASFPAPYGIYIGNQCDRCKVDHNSVQHYTTGYFFSADNGDFAFNNIQDDYDGLDYGVSFSRVEINGCYDVTDICFQPVAAEWGTTLVGNSVGDCGNNGGNGCFFVGSGDVVTGNMISSIKGGPAFRLQSSNSTISANVINMTQGQMTGLTRTNPLILNAVNGTNTINGNIIISTSGANEQEYAIELGTGTGSSVQGNTLIGTFKSNTQPYIHATSPGANTIKFNPGDITANGPAPYTVATLPACGVGNKGDTEYVTDATSPTYNGTLTGSGSVVVPVFCNGTAWLSH